MPIFISVHMFTKFMEYVKESLSGITMTEFSLQFLSVISIKCIYFHRPDLFFFLLFWVYSCTLHHTVGLDLSDAIVSAASSVSAYGSREDIVHKLYISSSCVKPSLPVATVKVG